jgi:hypothetical protein
MSPPAWWSGTRIRRADAKLALAEKVIQGRDFTVIRERQRRGGLAWDHPRPRLRQCPPAAALDPEPGAHRADVGGLGRARAQRHLGGPPLLIAAPKARRRSGSACMSAMSVTPWSWADRRGQERAAGLLALQFRRYAGAQIFAFDFGGLDPRGRAGHGRRLPRPGRRWPGAADACSRWRRIDEPAERAWAPTGWPRCWRVRASRSPQPRATPLGGAWQPGQRPR